MTLAEALAPYVATTRPPRHHACPPWSSECRYDDEDGFHVHARPATLQVTRQRDRTFEEPDPEVDVELYGQSNENDGVPEVYINETSYSIDQARTLALALLELVAVMTR